MVLTRSGNNDNNLRDERSWIGWFAIPVANSLSETTAYNTQFSESER